MYEVYEDALAALEQRGRKRALAPRRGLDFASNDYLALSEAPEMRRALHEALERGVAVGAGASRLLRGNHPEHEALEAEAAAFFGAERALFLGGGYVANFALLSTLPQRGDLLVYDALIHASSHEGMRAGRAEHIAAAHNDAGAIEDAIAGWRTAGNKGRVWIAVESLYSMDGDRAPLADIIAIADRHDGILLIDEAHATGVFGPEGRGLGADYEGRENVISVHTCGKALGASGALICAPAVLCDFLVNRCRAFIYATAPSPLMAVAVGTALSLLRSQPERRARLHGLIEMANRRLEAECGVPGSGSQILPVIIGPDAETMALAARLQARGLDIRGIRPPTVPEGTARLRIALTLNVNEAQTAAMLDALAEEMRGLAAA
ncbi:MULTISPECIES: 8-amino-7-oxononanoate synthase [Rhodomicrobium]|uniref:8-amino-7-oxononanoate synthase n=1 Tax=Rhodomicrobium TaxID=1068 RepID=UPI000B4BCD51|nr:MULTISPECIES: 8-amino-7-oxononanoate synthase [Rhodomicrobium]